MLLCAMLSDSNVAPSLRKKKREKKKKRKKKKKKREQREKSFFFFFNCLVGGPDPLFIAEASEALSK